MKKVIFCGTHPGQYNGYSKVVYELALGLSEYKDIKLHIFGFQNFYNKQDHKLERKLPESVEIYDVFANEEPKNKGFGENIIVDYVNNIEPDIIIIYNDLIVINSLLTKLKDVKNQNFKIVPYIDLVYKNEKNSLIMNIDSLCDSAIMFTDYWKSVISMQGFTKPLYVMEHAFNSNHYYPIPKSLSRTFFGIDEDDFIIVNLNRNQPRKRWDLCMMAFIKFISKHLETNIRLLIATSTQGGWDMVDIMISECRKYNISVDDLKKHLIIIQNPQQITDQDINVMYNVGDVGINTCDGEGFGLCNFEQAGIGVPQIVPNIGGFKDFFTKDNAILIEPQWSYYCDHSRDFVSGEAQICNVDDYANALEFAYNNQDKLKTLGKNARKHITENYIWNDKAKVFHDVIMKETKSPDSIFVELDINEIEDSSTSNEQIVSGGIDDNAISNMSNEEMQILIRKLIKQNKLNNI